MRTAAKLAGLAGALLLLGSVAPARGGGLVQLQFRLANFSAPLAISNRYWPLVPGRHVVYYEVSGDECIINDFVVTHQSKRFGGAYAGLRARVIADTEWLDEDCDGGRDVLLEDTDDWYAQDNAGNIWYFGEATTEFLYDDAGNLTGTSTLGSWEAGVDGAIAGLIMLARPANGLFYQQEFYAGIAEDQAKVIGTNTSVSIGLGDFSGCIVTKEWSPLSPGAAEHKHYCPNVGLVLVEKLGGKTAAVEAVDLGLP
jgi:hypothetical protein